MAAGYSRIRLFNGLGILIDELDAPTRRSWVLNGIGRCQFTLPIYDALAGGYNPKVTPTNLRYGNFVLIDHKPSQNADGTFNGLLPPWVGIILAPMQWSYGKVTVTAYSAEQLLFYRPMGVAYAECTLQGWVQLILKNANDLATKYGGVLLQPGAIEDKPSTIAHNFKVSALEEVQALCTGFGMDFDVTPVVSASNQLSLALNLYRLKGINTGQVMSNLNLQLQSPLYSEQGVFFNAVLGYPDVATNAVRWNTVSLGDVSNGILATKQVFPGTSGAAVDVIQQMSDTWLTQNGTPTRTFAPMILDVDNAFSYCNTGNVWLIQNDTVGFSNGSIGINGTIRITAQEYDELTNAVKLSGVLQ